MNNQFDELAKGLAESVTRRGALKKFGVGLALGSLGLRGRVETAELCPHGSDCSSLRPAAQRAKFLRSPGRLRSHSLRRKNFSSTRNRDRTQRA